MSTYLRRSFTPCSYCGYFSLHPECLTPKRDHQGQSGSSFLAEGNMYSHFTHYVSPPALPPLVRRYSRVLGHRKQGGSVASRKTSLDIKPGSDQWSVFRSQTLSDPVAAEEEDFQLILWEQQLVRWLCLGKSWFVVPLLLWRVFVRSLFRDIKVTSYKYIVWGSYTCVISVFDEAKPIQREAVPVVWSLETMVKNRPVVWHLSASSGLKQSHW